MSDVTGPDRDSASRDNPAMSRLRLALEHELGPDEVVIWHGWQQGRLGLRRFGIYLFGIPWTAFSVMWTALAAGAMAGSGEEGPGWIGWAFPMFGLPFVAVGLAMLAWPFVPRFQQGRVLYVVTSQRVLKLSLLGNLVVQAVPASRIGMVERHERRDSSGMLRLPIRIGQDCDGERYTEILEIGWVENVIGAQNAVNRIAGSAGKPAGSAFELPT